MKRTATLIAATAAMLMLSSCFTVNHFKLGRRYREDVKRYESVKNDPQSPASEQTLEYIRTYLDTAHSANRRWNNVRARLFLDMAEEHLDNIENVPQIPPGLMEIYERTEPFTPQPESSE